MTKLLSTILCDWRKNKRPHLAHPKLTRRENQKEFEKEIPRGTLLKITHIPVFRILIIIISISTFISLL